LSNTVTSSIQKISNPKKSKRAKFLLVLTKYIGILKSVERNTMPVKNGTQEKIATWLRHWPSGTSTSSTESMSMVLATDVGLKRSQNQDRVAILMVGGEKRRDSFAVAVVADGMGGMTDGFECAVLAISNFFDAVIRYRRIDPLHILNSAALEANRAVYDFSNASGGATLSAVFIDQSGVYTVNVGDSRIYARRTNGKRNDIVRLTVDDNLEEAVGGVGTELLQFIGMGPGLAPHVEEHGHSFDRMLISSDGVHFINKEVFREIFDKTSHILDISKQLLTFSRWRGSPDNASLVAIDVYSVLEELNNSNPVQLKILDPFGTLEFVTSAFATPTSPRSQSQKNMKVDNINPTPAKRIRRAHKPEKQDELIGEQLSIEIESVPEDYISGKN
jgi:serine/threonine protein phosphatase PrpC